MKTLKIFSVFLLTLSLQVQVVGKEYKYLENESGLSEITASNAMLIN